MTGCAILLHIGRVKIFELFPFGLGLAVTAVTQLADLLVKQALKGARMNRVAGQAAIRAFKGFMGDQNFLPGVLMTGETEGIPSGNEQVRVFRCVDIVAREALPVFKWYMFDDPASHQ